MIFAACQLQKKCQEQNVSLYTTFVDLTKAFGTVCRKRLWEIMAKFGCPAKFITMVRQFRDSMQARVQDDRVYSKPFPVTSGLKQGCVLAPTLFSMMFSAMLYIYIYIYIYIYNKYRLLYTNCELTGKDKGEQSTEPSTAACDKACKDSSTSGVEVLVIVQHHLLMRH